MLAFMHRTCYKYMRTAFLVALVANDTEFFEPLYMALQLSLLSCKSTAQGGYASTKVQSRMRQHVCWSDNIRLGSAAGCLCEVNECRYTNSDVPPRYHGLQELCSVHTQAKRRSAGAGRHLIQERDVRTLRQPHDSVNCQFPYSTIQASRLLIVTPSNQAADEVLMRLGIQTHIPRLQLLLLQCLLLQSSPANKGWKHLHRTWRSIDCSGHRQRCRDNVLHVLRCSGHRQRCSGHRLAVPVLLPQKVELPENTDIQDMVAVSFRRSMDPVVGETVPCLCSHTLW